MQDEGWWDWLWARILVFFYLFIIVGVLYEVYQNAPNLFWGIIVVGGGIFLWASASGKSDIQKARQRIAKEKEENSLKAIPRPITSKPYDGHVYLIREEHGQYKIGRTVDVPNRFNTLKIQVPYDITNKLKIPGPCQGLL